MEAGALSSAWAEPVRLAEGFRVIAADTDAVLVASEDAAIELKGDLYRELLSRLDGTRSAECLAEELDAFAPEEVYYALMRLERRGLLATNGVTAQPLSQTTLSIETFGTVQGAAQRVVRAVSAIGARVSRDNQGVPDLRVLLVADYLRDDVDARARQLCKTDVPWLLAKPVGSSVWIGPAFWPGDTVLWEHLRRRLAENRLASLGLASNSAVPELSSGAALVPALDAAANLIALAIARAVTGAGAARDAATFVSIDVAAAESHVHRLTPVVSETPPFSAFESWPLQSRIKQYTYDGGHRVCAPAETCDRLRPFVDRLVGIIPELRLCGDETVHIYSARQTLAAAMVVRESVSVHKSWGAAGKGATREQAEASCLAEAVERYCCSFRGDEPRRTATFSELGETAISPDALQLYSQRQFDRREQLNAVADKHHRIPQRFAPDANVEWSPVRSLTHDRTRWIPTACCYLSYPRSPERDFFGGTSNGLASGNVVEEAILQGFLELVERDAAAIWWYNRLNVPAVDLASFGDPYLVRMQRYHEAAGRTLDVLDVTTDLGIPAMVAVSRVTATGGRILLGCGAHLDARIAASRAISELMQVGFHEFAESREREEAFASFEGGRVHWIRTATAGEHPYLLPAESAKLQAGHYPNLASNDVLHDVHRAIETVRRAGHELFVLDATRKDVGFPVVRVFVPGLRHFFSRFAPGRLYDVPVRTGAFARALAEDRLNPVGWPFA